MSAGDPAERQARVTLSFLADPGDVVLGATLRTQTAARTLASVTGANYSGSAHLADTPDGQALAVALRTWRRRLGLVPSPARLAAWQDSGLRTTCPGDPDWPVQLDDLGDARPLLLWTRGSAGLRYACLRSVAVVGARAATAYGQHVGLQLSADLAGRGMTVISGGA